MRLIELGDIDHGMIVMGLVTPMIYTYHKEHCDLGQEYRRAGFKLDTSIRYEKSNNFELFTFSILGIGFFVSYQKGYKNE